MSSIKYLIFMVMFGGAINHNIAQVASIKLISPNGGEQLKIGQRYGISWISNNIKHFDIYYNIKGDQEWIEIKKNISTDLGIYSWKVPQLPLGKIKIKIESSADSLVYDISDEYALITEKINVSGKPNLLNKYLTGQTIKIMPLGNSITFDNRVNDTRAVEDKIGYRWPLYNLLTNSGFNFEFIGSEHAGSNILPSGFDANAGFPGITDDQLFNLLKTGKRVQPPDYNDTITPGPYLETYSPDIILLHIGTNGNNLSGGTNAGDVEDILNEIDRYEDSVGVIIPVILARIINRSPNEPYVTTFNNNVEVMAYDRVSNPANSAYPDDIIFVNMEQNPEFDYTIDSWGTIGDGIPGDMNDLYHPNDKGYSKMADRWFIPLNAFLRNCPNNMISYWKMNEKGSFSTISDKLGINNGYCTGSTSPAETNGMNNGALFFDGVNDEVVVPNSYSLNLGNALNFTVEAWIKTSQTGMGNKVFLGMYNLSSTAWWLGMNVEDSLAYFSFRSSSNNDILEIKGSSKIIDGNWHHIVGAKNFDSGDMKIYVDGNLENTASASFSGDFSGTNPLTMGCYDNNYYYNGKLDEVAIYDRALSDAEISQHYNDGLKSKGYCNENEFFANTTIFLQGPYSTVTGQMSSDLKNSGAIPLTQPFDTAPYNYSGAERVTSIPNTTPAIVDWILMELRSGLSASTSVKKRAAFIRADGSIVDLDGSGKVSFSGVPNGNYYIVVYHRNHLPVMSAGTVPFTN